MEIVDTRIERALKRYKEILRLRAERYKFREIAEMFGVTASAIAHRVYRGEPVSSLQIKISYPKDYPFEIPNGRDRVREMVRIRDNYTCQMCGLLRTKKEVYEHNSKLPTNKGKRKSLDVHHLDGMCGKKSRGYDTMENIDKLITLCHKCHYNHPHHSNKTRSPQKS